MSGIFDEIRWTMTWTRTALSIRHFFAETAGPIITKILHDIAALGALFNHAYTWRYPIPFLNAAATNVWSLPFWHKIVWPKGWQITLKRGVVLLTWSIFCMHCCGVRTKSPLHSVICYQPCPRRRLLSITHPMVDGGAAHSLRLKLHRFDFSPCLLQTLLYNI